jgi:hypothetical protein
MHDIIEWLEMQPELNDSLQKMNAYREQYGISTDGCATGDY